MAVQMRWSRTTSGILLLAVVAFALRIAAVWLVGDATTGPVTYEHGEIARNLLAGRGFTVKFLGVEGPTSQQRRSIRPCWPAATRFGANRPRRFPVSVAPSRGRRGDGAVVLWLGWSLCPRQPTIGWVAAWCAAVYPPHIYMVTHVQVVTWACLWLSLLLAIVASTAAGRHLARSCAGGLDCGAAPVDRADPGTRACPWRLSCSCKRQQWMALAGSGSSVRLRRPACWQRPRHW